jgi:membrane protease YdiL (CAAX protease family)
MPRDTATTPSERVPRTVWVALVAAAVYVLLAAGLGNLLDALVDPGSPTAEFAITHLVPLPIAIAAGLAFARWSGWWHDIWTTPRVTAARPRRLWMLAVPVLMLIIPTVGLTRVPWAERAVGFVLVAAVGCLLIGLGEELFYRGILRVGIRAHHGELVTLLAVSLLFGLSHSFGSLINDVPPSTIAFQVAFTAMDGALLYTVLRVTGRLWVPILLHAFTDFSLYVQSADSTPAVGHAPDDPDPVLAAAQTALIVLSVVVVISTALEDRRTRRERRASTTMS